MSAKKPPQVTDSPGQELYRPTRPIGLARALQKAGYGTRKTAEGLVLEGRVKVDGEVQTDPKQMVTRDSHLELDGKPLVEVELRYFAFHKPVRVVCTKVDGPELRLASEYFPPHIPGLTAVGRMNGRSSGLLLVTNDKDWAHRITEQSALVQEYRIQVEGELSEMEISVITAGIHLPKLGIIRPLSVKIIEKLNHRTVMLMEVGEGKIRQVRKMFSTLRHRITLVRRLRVGEVRLGTLPAGGLRALTQAEIKSLVEGYQGPGKPPATG